MTEPVWGGRFSRGPNPDMMRLTSSIEIDIRLLEHDLAATRAHARVLAKAGLLDADALERVDEACAAILDEWHSGDALSDEDVHSLVERLLTERLGDIGAGIHAGRSRNDLVATDLRLWCRQHATVCMDRIASILELIADRGAEHAETVMPGYTHLQRAQPVTLGFHLLAHAFALARDGARFAAARRAANVSSLGAGALAGTTLPLEPSVAADELGFEGLFDNAMDAISDRDFACDLVYAAAMCGVHLSRLAEDVVLWTSSEFAFARLPDEWSTGSSMMPQKRNPDVAELVRGRAAGGIGDLAGLLALLKGLPLAYDRDLQEDKGLVFGAVDRVENALESSYYLLEALEFDRARMAAAAGESATWATDLAEALVARGMPFREAHRAVAGLIGDLEAAGLHAATAATSNEHRALFDQAGWVPGDARSAVGARSSHGGPAPERVAEQIERLRALAADLRASG